MRRSLQVAATVAASTLLVGVVATVPASSSTVPGLTSSSVTLGAIVTDTGLATADFPPYIDGVKAYLEYVNAHGGVNHRQLDLPSGNILDDASIPTNDVLDARQLVASDHVFSIVGVASAFFNPKQDLPTPQTTPVFGYAAQNVWKGPKDFFADYGSVIDYATSVPDFAYVAKHVGGTRVAVFALDYQSSQDECAPAVKSLQKTYGVDVVYSNLNEPPLGSTASTYAIDVTRMIQKNVNMVITCMDGSDSNIALNEAMQNGGMSAVPEVWLDGYDRSLIKNDAAYMHNVYLMLQHVPFEAATDYPGKFPGLALYFNAMNAAGFASAEYDDVALMGWESANLFAQGLKAAGANPTQASVVTAINKITNDVGGPSGDGVTSPTNWTVAHTKITPPSCVTFVKTDPSTSSFQMAFNSGSDPWVCFPLTGKANLSKPLHPPAGSPGA